MSGIFEEENRVQKMLDVEAALALAHGEGGNIPRKDAEKIAKMASTEHVKIDRVRAIEKEIKHGVAAWVRGLAKAGGTSGANARTKAATSCLISFSMALT